MKTQKNTKDFGKSGSCLRLLSGCDQDTNKIRNSYGHSHDVSDVASWKI